jgi:membrane dipeptidase
MTPALKKETPPPMILVDAHQDLAYNIISHGRDYTLPVYKQRRLQPNANLPTLGLPDALLGRVAVIFGTIFVAPKGLGLAPQGNEPLYADAREAYALAGKQLDIYERLAGENEHIRLIQTAADLDAVLATWEPDRPLTERVQGIVVLMEGADPIIEPQQFEEWYERGLRVVGPAWHKTRYSAGTGEPGPLTPLGFELLEVMADAGALLDLSHLAEEAFYQALDRYEGPLIASHSNPRRFCDRDRHLSDDMIRRLAERDGVIGVVVYNRFLSHNWVTSDGRAKIPFTTLLDVIDHICQVTGSAAHVGIGSDLDGGFGLESIPAGMDTVGDLWWLTTGLRRRGYGEDDIAAIAGGNFLRKLRESLPTA